MLNRPLFFRFSYLKNFTSIDLNISCLSGLKLFLIFVKQLNHHDVQFQFNGVKKDSATFTYNLPSDNTTKVDNVQVRLNETATGISSTIVEPVGQPIPLKNLKPGTNYTVQARSMVTDGRNSSFSRPVSFTPGSYLH